MKTKNLKLPIYLTSVFILICAFLFLTLGLNFDTMEYSLSRRIPKLIAIVLTGFSIGLSTFIFQTITHNNILTPNVMGLDSLYTLIQTSIVLFLGSSSFFVTNKKVNFFVCVIIMTVLSVMLFDFLFKKEKSNILYLVLIGMICGTLFSSISSFMQVVIDPNEFLVLQNKLIASFNNVNIDIVIIAIILMMLTTLFIIKDIKYLDVISLSKDNAINLGVDYDFLVKKFFIAVSIFVSISTALVGPIAFFGILVVNVTRQILNTYKHSYNLTLCVLISIFTLVFAQLLVERILKLDTPISVIINLIGGIYFIYLLFKESKL